MKAFTKKVLGRAAGLTFVIGMTTTSVIADDWKTASELRNGQGASTQSVSQSNSKLSSTTSQEFLKHRSPLSVTSGERMQLRAKVAGNDGVKIARVYFKTASAERYNFVVLNKGDRGIYSATIPAVGSSVTAVEYKIVIQNAFGEVYKTEKYSVPVRASNNNQVAQNDGFIDVFSEYPEQTAETSGFIDNVRYTYSAAKLVTSLGSGVSVASSGSGYVGGASTTASGTAGTSAGTAASTGSAGSAATGSAAAAGSTAGAASATAVAAVGAGSVAVAVAADPSGIEGNDYGSRKSYGSGECFDGFLESEQEGATSVIEFRSGVPYGGSVSTVDMGCATTDDVNNGTVIVADIEFPEDFCVTEEMVDLAISEYQSDPEFGTLSIVSGHSCPVVVIYSN